MKTIIHIGQHKTGTTSLQHYLQNNRSELQTLGLYVPDSLVGISHPSHYILNVYALDENRFSPMKESLLASKSTEFFSTLEERLQTDISRHYKLANEAGCHTIIWSNEGLYLLNSLDEYQKLASLFTNYSNDILCVCTFRDKVSFRRSYSQQLIKQGLAFSSNKDSYRYVSPDSWLFNYSNKKQLLSNVFDNNLFLEYSSRDMTKIFLKSLGFPLLIKDLYLNVSEQTS